VLQYTERKYKYHKENTEALVEASRENALEVNTVKSRHKNVGQNHTHNLKAANKHFENMAKLKYSETKVRN
jgi:hypothetical protein